MNKFWLVATIVGAIGPYAIFVPWLIDHGLDLPLLVTQATATPIAAFAWMDVLISAVVLVVLAARGIGGGQRVMWSVVAGTCLVGVSLGLPLYLFLNERDATRLKAQ